MVEGLICFRIDISQNKETSGLDICMPEVFVLWGF